MAPAGAAAEKSRTDTVAAYGGKYIAAVEGSILIGEGGIYGTIGGRNGIELQEMLR